MRARRLAAIDIGTNSVLLTVVEQDGDQLRVLVDRATITRLGRNVDRDRRISQESSQRTLACLADYGRELATLGVDALDVVGTSALRDARGADEFVASAGLLLGIVPRVVAGGEEAQLTFEGSLSGLPVAGDVAVVDIGGGSTEVIVGRAEPGGGSVAELVSLQVGSVRLHERTSRSDPPGPSELEALRGAARDAFRAAPRVPAQVTLVGVAGTVTTLAAISLELGSYDGARVHGARLEASHLEALVSRLSSATLAERRLIRGLEPARADVIVAGAVLAAEALAWSGQSSMLVSDRGVRWGLLRRLARLEAGQAQEPSLGSI